MRNRFFKISQLGIQKAIACLIVIGSLGVTFVGTDRYFPFSNYPMYAPLTRSVFKAYIVRIVVRTTSEGVQERPIDPNLLRPFWLHAFREALFANYEESRFTEKLSATLRWYSGRLEKIDPAAASRLLGIRVYRYEVPWAELTTGALTSQQLSQRVRNNMQLVKEALK